MNKQELRKYYLDKRKNMLPDERKEKSTLIADIFFKSFYTKLTKIKYIHTFLPIQSQNEVDTEILIALLQKTFPHITIVLSKSNFKDASLEHFEFTKNTKLITNNYGIREPENGRIIDTALIDIVLVPLLAVDYHGNRIGYGKGFYDRFLITCRPDCIKIGLSYEQPVSSIMSEQHDISVDFCITPEKIYPLKKQDTF